MDCKKYELYIVALSLDEREGLSRTALAQAEAHLRDCPACRKSLEETRQVVSILAPEPKEISRMVEPADTTRLMAAIERNVARRSLQRLTKIAATVLIGVGLAGFVAVGVRSLRQQPEQQAPVAQDSVQEAPAILPTRIVRAPEPPPVPKLSAMEESFLAAKTSDEAYKVLQDAFYAAHARKNGDIDDYPTIITLCERLKEKWPVSNGAYYGLRLTSRCWEQLGEIQKAQEVFIAYADYNGELERRQELKRGKTPEQAEAVAVEIASREILGEAETLFAAREYTRSLSYCDVLLTRYPTHERGLLALHLIGAYSAKHRQYDEAIRVYRQIIELNPDSSAAEMARLSLPDALVNSKHRDEAAQAWLECAQRAKTKHEQANYTLNAGVVLSIGGEKYDAAAMALLEKVIMEYPDEREWVGLARESVDAIRLRPFKKDLRGVGNPVEILNL